MRLLVTFAGLLAVSASLAQAGQLVIKGSDTLGAKLVPQIKEAYEAEHPGTTFSIAAEGSTTGFAALIDNTADIAMASRPAKVTELSVATAKGHDLRSLVVAWDGIAVLVNSSNPITSLTKKQVEEIFTGDVADWSAVGGAPGTISVYTRNTSSGTYSEWKELAMNKRDYAQSAQKMAGNEQIASEIGKNPAGIGYVGLAYIHVPGVKVVAVDGVRPDQESVREKKYPYSRPTFFYTNGVPNGETKSFIDFVIGPEGQKIVDQVGFVPIK